MAVSSRRAWWTCACATWSAHSPCARRQVRGITVSLHLEGGKGFSNLAQIVGRQVHGGGTHVLLQAMELGGAGDGPGPLGHRSITAIFPLSWRSPAAAHRPRGRSRCRRGGSNTGPDRAGLGKSSISGSRVHREYSVRSAATECTAWARRFLAVARHWSFSPRRTPFNASPRPSARSNDPPRCPRADPRASASTRAARACARSTSGCRAARPCR